MIGKIFFFLFNIFLLIQFNAGNENPRSPKGEYLNAHRHPAAPFVDLFEFIEWSMGGGVIYGEGTKMKRRKKTPCRRFSSSTKGISKWYLPTAEPSSRHIILNQPPPPPTPPTNSSKIKKGIARMIFPAQQVFFFFFSNKMFFCRKKKFLGVGRGGFKDRDFKTGGLG